MGGWRKYYEHAGITIIHGDAFEAIHDVAGDVVLTDPPYGVRLGEKANNQRFDRVRYKSTDDSPEFVKRIANELVPVMRQRFKRVVITPGVKHLFEYPRPDHTGAFYYPAASGCNAWGFSCWQPILYYGKDPYAGKGSRPDSFESVEAAVPNGHPCPKPIGQWKALLNRVAVSGDVIVDPFVGSGTGLVAAKDSGFKATGIEIEEAYCEIAALRLSQEVLFP